MWQEKSFAYWYKIPAGVLFYDSNKLPCGAKLLYTYILALSNKDGFCYASNDHLSKKLGISKRSLSRYFTILIDLDFISVSLKPDDKRRRFVRPLRFL